MIVEEELRNDFDGLHTGRPRADDRRDEDIQCVDPLDVRVNQFHPVGHVDLQIKPF